ncbi:MAG TPA: IS200/IS605 family transposase [Bacteroidetes bacterium]|nr:IS200/IS605 family transposase [Bacteroidota bacterium]
MAYVKVMIHAVWGTKNRESFLTTEIKPVVIKHIRENAKEKKIFIDTIDGSTEHLHCLFGLNAEMSISKALQLMKGESAFWMNVHKITKTKFEWADEYYAVSVSESQLEKVRAYILNQEEHHKKVTFQDEYEEFMRVYNFEHHG